MLPVFPIALAESAIGECPSCVMKERLRRRRPVSLAWMESFFASSAGRYCNPFPCIARPELHQFVDQVIDTGGVVASSGECLTPRVCVPAPACVCLYLLAHIVLEIVNKIDHGLEVH